MLIGCVLATIGVGLCYTATSVNEIILHVGIIQGFGIGLTYVQNSAIINSYFVKFRATANGMSMAGGTVGAFALSFLMEWALKHFNLQECFLLLATISLTTLPVCLLLRPFKEKLADDVVRPYVLSLPMPLPLPANPICTKTPPPLAMKFARRQSSISQPVKALGKLVLGQLLYMERKMSLSYEPPAVAVGQVAVGQDTTKEGKNVVVSGNGVTPTVVPSNPSTCTSGSAYTSAFSGTLFILKNPFFILTALTHMAYFWSSITFMMIIVDYAGDKKIAVHSSIYLINAFSGGDLIGRLGSGWLMDNKLIPLKYLALVSSVGIGLLLQATTMTCDFHVLMAISGVLGLLSGLINILLNILFCKYLGTKRAPLAFGLSAFFCGLVTLLRPMVVGYFRDGGGSYDGLLSLLGFGSAVTGCLWFLEPCLARYSFGDKLDEKPIVQDVVHVQLPAVSISVEKGPSEQ